jgi:UDP-N-acetylmuramoylalanine--D-glutamate ligase
MKNLADQHVLVLGLGHSGLALARWCARCGAQVTVADTRAEPPQLAALCASIPSARFVQAEMNAALLDETLFAMVLKSPG